MPDGRQVKKTIGPAWTERGRPPAGYYTKRTAEAWLRDVFAQARAGTLPGMVRTGVTFADACDEYLRYVEVDLDRKPFQELSNRALYTLALTQIRIHAPTREYFARRLTEGKTRREALCALKRQLVRSTSPRWRSRTRARASAHAP